MFINRTVKYICKKTILNYFTIYRHKHYVTTPIFYANSNPHIGHLYTALIADAICRYQKLKTPKENVSLMTGTDEHGLKIHQAAALTKTPVELYVDHISRQYRDLFNVYNINYSDFLRTTEDRHNEATSNLWKKLSSNGHIYKGEYAGWYCIADEAFVPEQNLQTLENGSKSTIEGNRPVEFVTEVNYKFRLSSFKNDLLHWLREERVYPHKFHKILYEWIEEGTVLEDISISRPKHRVSWGIPVPGDNDHTIYVWLDALSCYLTSAGYPNKLNNWPPDVQVVGKDILKFHGVFWPAFLVGAGLDPPKKLLCHSHWIIDGEKMSKSKGNVIDPTSEADKYTYDGFRYFLLREGVPHSDGNYTPVKVQRILNSELADTLGNLLNRCTGALVNAKQIFPPFSKKNFELFSTDALTLMRSVEALPGLVDSHYMNFEFYKGIDAIVATLHLANEFFDRKKPWELRKELKYLEELHFVLHITMETLRVCGILLSPITPSISSHLLSKLSVPESERVLANLSPLSWQNTDFPGRELSTEKNILFQRLR